MKQKKYLVHFLLIAVLMACQNDKKEPASGTVQATKKAEVSLNCPNYIVKNKKNNLNISILLDLSDRIVDSKIIEKDTAYLNRIAKTFTNHIKSKKLILLEDRIQLFFSPPPTNGKINKTAEKLKVYFTKDSPKAQIIKTEKLYAEKPIALYELAKEDATEPEDYPGSDIWRFFKDHVTDYAISDCHRNILIILTDGYMFYENTLMQEENKTTYLTPKYLDRLGLDNSKWKNQMDKKELGFIKANENLENLEVLVLGIQNKNTNNPYTLDIIKKYWTDWLNEMGVKNIKIKNTDLPSNVEKVITDFIL